MWQKRVKKTIFTLNVNDYSPEMTSLTYPLIQAYARKIGADFHVIRERKFPEWPVTYEKMQVYELAQQMENDWNIYIDSDTLVHPDTPDLTLLLPRDTVAHFGSDFAPTRWKTDRFFHRDGRHIGSGNWLALASDLCIELWKPVDDLTPAEAVANINPTVTERTSGVIETSHLIDDYVLSRNIAKYGLKYVNIRDLLAKNYRDGGGFFYHQYLFPIERKIEELHEVIDKWQVAGLMREIYGAIYPRNPVSDAAMIPGRMSRAELYWLYETAKEMKSVVEIGSLQGRSTFALCSGCNGDQGKVYAIDPFIFEGGCMFDKDLHLVGYKPGDSFFREFLKNCCHFPQLTAIKKTSLEVAASDIVPPLVDMVFIDGNHDFNSVMADLKAWAPRAKKLISGHDLDHPQCPGVRQALNKFFGMDRVEAGPDTIWSVKVE
jgi:hypothetical protein